jgi:hypothetical protein
MSYTIALQDKTKTYQVLAAAIEFATKKAKELGTEVEIVDAETNGVAHVATYVEGRHFHPWERVENIKFQHPHFEGFYPAYSRKRITTVVYRSYDDEAEFPWRVWDGRTGGHLDVATTKAARLLCTEMKNGRQL